MKTYILIPLLCVSLFAAAQENIPAGQGVIKIDYEKLPALHFFKDTNQINPEKTVTILKDKEGGYRLKNYKEVLSWFKPESLSMDYDIFFIRIDTVIGKWYRVMTDNEKGTFRWTKADKNKKFINWSSFWKKETTSISKGFADLEIKIAPDDAGKKIKKMENADCFEVLEVKGDWLRIRTNTILDCSESKKPLKSGWIKWRDNNRVTISYSLSC